MVAFVNGPKLPFERWDCCVKVSTGSVATSTTGSLLPETIGRIATLTSRTYLSRRTFCPLVLISTES